MPGHTHFSDCREPKTEEELRIIMAQTIGDLAGSIVVSPDAISMGPDANAEGNWWYGYDTDVAFAQVAKDNKVILRQQQGKYRLRSWMKSPVRNP